MTAATFRTVELPHQAALIKQQCYEHIIWLHARQRRR